MERGFGTPILGGLLTLSIKNANNIKTWATDKIQSLTQKNNDVTSEVYNLQQSFTVKEEEYQGEIETLKGALNDANPMITQLQTDLGAMTKQYEDARTQLQTLHDYQSKIDTEKIGQMLADAQRVK
jgi:chromosome segregation ATPase